jgi:hypothetical protein
MDVELREALTQGFGPEPAHRPVSDRVEAGHRAVRRRRIAGAVVTVAVASIVGIGSVALLGGDGDAGSQVATDPTPDPTAEPTTEPAAEWGEGELARYDNEGDLVVRPGVTVLDRVDEPYGDATDYQHSVALALEFQGTQSWLIMEWDTDPDGASSSSSGAGAAPQGDFQDWVAQNVAANDDNSAGYVEFADDGSLVSSHGVQILDQRHPVQLKNFVLAGEPSAAALLQGPDGKKWYVVVRDSGGLDVIATPFRTGGPDLDAFLDYAREKYASGEGLR